MTMPSISSKISLALLGPVALATTSGEKKRRIMRLVDPADRHFVVNAERCSGIEPDVAEAGNEFANAVAKASAFSCAFACPALGWDMGLYFDHLPEPGAFIKRVRSTGGEGTPQDIFAAYRSLLDTVPPHQRTGHIKSALALATPDGQIYVTVVRHRARFITDGEFSPDGSPLDGLLVLEGTMAPYSTLGESERTSVDRGLQEAIARLVAEHWAERVGKDTRRSVLSPHQRGMRYVFGDRQIKLYRAQEREAIDDLTQNLGNFYGGHERGWATAQYGALGDGGDPYGFLSRWRQLLVLSDGGLPIAMASVVWKRGGAMKVNTVAVSPAHARQGLGRRLVGEAIDLARSLGARKVYCTAARENAAACGLFASLKFQEEARLPNQYMTDCTEVVYGLLFHAPAASDYSMARMLLQDRDGDIDVVLLDPVAEKSAFSSLISEHYAGWHNDVGDDFVDAMIRGSDRGLDVETKGKMILVTRELHGTLRGAGVLTLKRGEVGSACAVKLDPYLGDRASLSAIAQRTRCIAREHLATKIYTFAPTSDQRIHPVLGDLGFTQRGRLREAYKAGCDLIVYDAALQVRV